MLIPLNTKEQATLVKNIVASCKDITKLSKKAYQFVSNASGFIAHYDHHGFIATYEDESLEDDLIRNAHFNTRCNRSPSDVDYGYYKAKANVYQSVVEALGGNISNRNFR